MSDFGENLPIAAKDQILETDKKQEDVWRDTKIHWLEENAEALAWARSIVSSTVLFPRPDGKMVWGVEYTIPLCFEDVEEVYKETLKQLDKKNILQEDDLNKGLEKRKTRRFYRATSLINLPDNIRKIRVLDLSPQEGLPKHLRNIDSKRSFYHVPYNINRLQMSSGKSVIDKVLLTLFQESLSNIKRIKALNELFYDVFGENKKEIELFKSILNNSKASEVLFVHAHGGSSNIIGEQTSPVVGKYADRRQVEGNRIDLTEVIEKYDKPKIFAAILVSTCYIGKEDPPVRSVPVFRIKGLSGGFRGTFGLNRTIVSLPEKK